MLQLKALSNFLPLVYDANYWVSVYKTRPFVVAHTLIQAKCIGYTTCGIFNIIKTYTLERSGSCLYETNIYAGNI